MSSFFGRIIRADVVGQFQFCETRHQKHARLDTHRHEQPYLTIVKEGSYSEETARETRRCATGSVVVHPAAESHADVFDADALLLNLYWPGAETHPLMSRPGVFDAASAHRLAAGVSREIAINDIHAGLGVEGLLLQLAAEIGRRCSGAGPRRTPAWLAVAKRIIDERFLEPLSLRDVAGAVGVDPSTLARSFRDDGGFSVGEALRRRRIEHATQLLRSSRPLTDIALECGFADQSHFTRVFRSMTGSTPAVFRSVNRVP